MFVKSVLRNLSHTERENSEEKTPGVSTGRNTVDSSAPAHSDNLNSSSFGLPPAYGGQARDSKDSKSDNATLNKLFQVEVAIQGLEVQIVGVERDVEEVQEVYASGGVLKGKQGNFLIVEEERLVRKEQQLREKETQLRAEKILLLQSCRAKTTARNSLDDIPEGRKKCPSSSPTMCFSFEVGSHDISSRSVMFASSFTFVPLHRALFGRPLLPLQFMQITRVGQSHNVS